MNENMERVVLGSLGFLTHGRSSGQVPQMQEGPHDRYLKYWKVLKDRPFS